VERKRKASTNREKRDRERGQCIKTERIIVKEESDI
jgi:hypothetical protein